MRVLGMGVEFAILSNVTRLPSGQERGRRELCESLWEEFPHREHLG